MRAVPGFRLSAIHADAPRFERRLNELYSPADTSEDIRVEVMTIHGAKGLEAPIVWLLGGSDHTRGDSYGVLAPWPPEAQRPQHFSLFGKQADFTRHEGENHQYT